MHKSRIILILLLATATISVAVGQSDHGPKATEINRRPLTDFAAHARQALRSGDVDLKADFVVELSGRLTPEGKIDPTTAVFTRQEGSPAMVDLVQRSVEAVNDSGFFQYLSNLEGENLRILLHQDGSHVGAGLIIKVANATRARSFETVLSLGVSLARQQKIGEEVLSLNEQMEVKLLSAISITTNDNEVSISLKMPKAEFHEMADHFLKEE